jgi:hypothetical protein
VAEASLADGTPAVLGRPLAERLEILVAAAAVVWRPAAGSGLSAVYLRSAGR